MKPLSFEEAQKRLAKMTGKNVTKLTKKAVNPALKGKKGPVSKTGPMSVAAMDDAVIEKCLEEDVKTNLVSKNVANQMIQARNEKQMTQEQLAKALNVSKADIREIENANFPYNGKLMSRIAKKLGTKFTK